MRQDWLNLTPKEVKDGTSKMDLISLGIIGCEVICIICIVSF